MLNYNGQRIIEILWENDKTGLDTLGFDMACKTSLSYADEPCLYMHASSSIPTSTFQCPPPDSSLYIQMLLKIDTYHIGKVM